MILLVQSLLIFILFLLIAKLVIQDLKFKHVESLYLSGAILISILFALTLENRFNVIIDALAITGGFFLFELILTTLMQDVLSKISIFKQHAEKLRNTRAIGEADIFCFFIVFIFIPVNNLFLFVVFFSLSALIIHFILNLNKKNMDSGMALIPYITLGAILTYSLG